MYGFVIELSHCFRHEELLARGEVYSGMWQQQLVGADQADGDNGHSDGDKHSASDTPSQP